MLYHSVVLKGESDVRRRRSNQSCTGKGFHLCTLLTYNSYELTRLYVAKNRRVGNELDTTSLFFDPSKQANKLDTTLVVVFRSFKTSGNALPLVRAQVASCHDATKETRDDAAASTGS